MASVDRSLVAHLPMFAGLTPAEQDELLREARSIRYPKGSAVFDQGADADRFYILIHGHLRVEKTTPFKYSLYEGQDIGEDSGSPVDFSYAPPFKFTGKLGRVTVELK